jgi:hypothetical protein
MVAYPKKTVLHNKVMKGPEYGAITVTVLMVGRIDTVQ